jgi:hypothetical protein
VTPDEALTVLGLTAPAAEDQIRRAYLRALKTAKPERDPEAFLRVRAAYDVLRDVPTAYEAPDESDDRGLAPTASPEGEGVDLQADFPPDLPPPIEIVALPEEQQAEEQPTDAGTAVEIVATDRPPDDHDELRRALSEDRLADAVPLVVAAFDGAGPDATPPVDEMIELMLKLHRIGRVDVARSIAKPVMEWLHRYADERKVMREHAARWSMVRDLEGVPADAFFPPSARQVFAHFALEGGGDQLRAQLREYAESYPEHAAHLAHTIRQHLPGLEPFADDLAPRPGVQHKDIDPIMIVLAVLMLAIFALIFVVNTDSAKAPAPAASGSATAVLDPDTKQLMDRLDALELQTTAHHVGTAALSAANGRCKDVDETLTYIPSSLKRAPPEARALQPEFVKLVARIAAKCPAPLPTNASPTTWPFE